MRKRNFGGIAIALTLQGCFGLSKSLAPVSASVEPIESSVRVQALRVLETHCLGCHSTSGVAASSSFHLNAPESFLSATDEMFVRAGWIVPGDPAQSRLLLRTRFSGGGAANMPPQTGSFSASDYAALANWVQAMRPGGGAVPSAGEPIRFECAPGQQQVHAQPTLRLTRNELKNTLRDLALSLTPSEGLHPQFETQVLAALERIPLEDVSDYARKDQRIGPEHASATLLTALAFAEFMFRPAAAPSVDYWAARALSTFSACPQVYSGLSAQISLGCAEAFIRGFGKRAYRRPLSGTEIQEHLAIFQSSGDGLVGLKDVTAALLASPHLTYRFELEGQPSAQDPQRIELTSYEIATRLSYTFWQSMPDATPAGWAWRDGSGAAVSERPGLMDLADRDQLRSEAGLGLAMQMILDPTPRGWHARTPTGAPMSTGIPSVGYLNAPSTLARTRGVLRDFPSQWLRLDRVPRFDSGNLVGISNAFEGMMHRWNEDFARDWLAQGGSTSSAPRLTSEDMQREVVDLFDHLVFERGAKVSDVLTSRTSVTSAPALAHLYGVSPARTGQPLPEVPSSERSGILTRAAFALTRTEETHPLRTGAMIRKQLLCDSLQSPGDVGIAANEIQPPAYDPFRTTRQRIHEATSADRCAGCHSKINDLGFAFEAYDSIGRYRTTESIWSQSFRAPPLRTLPLDLEVTPRVFAADSQRVRGPVELSEVLARSERVDACFVRHGFRYVYGRDESVAQDACTLEQMREAQATGGIAEMLRRMVLSPQFRNRRMVP